MIAEGEEDCWKVGEFGDIVYLDAGGEVNCEVVDDSIEEVEVEEEVEEEHKDKKEEGGKEDNNEEEEEEEDKEEEEEEEEEQEEEEEEEEEEDASMRPRRRTRKDSDSDYVPDDDDEEDEEDVDDPPDEEEVQEQEEEDVDDPAKEKEKRKTNRAKKGKTKDPKKSLLRFSSSLASHCIRLISLCKTTTETATISYFCPLCKENTIYSSFQFLLKHFGCHHFLTEISDSRSVSHSPLLVGRSLLPCFPCVECPERFSQKDSLVVHYAANHGDAVKMALAALDDKGNDEEEEVEDVVNLEIKVEEENLEEEGADAVPLGEVRDEDVVIVDLTVDDEKEKDDNPSGLSLSCPLCRCRYSSSFASRESLLEHLSRKHFLKKISVERLLFLLDDEFKCLLCQTECPSRDELAVHYGVAHGDAEELAREEMKRRRRKKREGDGNKKELGTLWKSDLVTRLDKVEELCRGGGGVDKPRCPLCLTTIDCSGTGGILIHLSSHFRREIRRGAYKKQVSNKKCEESDEKFPDEDSASRHFGSDHFEVVQHFLKAVADKKMLI